MDKKAEGVLYTTPKGITYTRETIIADLKDWLENIANDEMLLDEAKQIGLLEIYDELDEDKG
jgi:hypothetical protein